MSEELKKVNIIFNSGAKTTTQMTGDEFDKLRVEYHSPSVADFKGEGFSVELREVVFVEVLK